MIDIRPETIGEVLPGQDTEAVTDLRPTDATLTGSALPHAEVANADFGGVSLVRVHITCAGFSEASNTEVPSFVQNVC